MIQRKYLLLAAIAGLIVAVDQLVKLYVHTHFQLHETIPVIENYFNLTYVRNTGAAFGIFKDSHEVFRTIFFMSMPPIACLIILFILRTVPNEDRLQIFALAGVFGGAIGNYIDRIRLGFVVDYLDFHIKNKYTWPAFNVADSTIVVGIGVLMYLMYKEGREEKVKKSKAGARTELLP